MEVTVHTNKYRIEEILDNYLYLDRNSLNLLKSIYDYNFKHRVVSKLADLIWEEIIKLRSQYLDTDTFEFDIPNFIEYQIFSSEWESENVAIDYNLDIKKEEGLTMKSYEENMKTWNEIVEGVTHPMHKYILNEFHSDITQDIVFQINNSNVENDFNSIMNYVLKYLLMHLQVKIKNTTQYELLEQIMNDSIQKVVEDSFLKMDGVDIYYLINDFESEENVLKEMKEDELAIENLNVTMTINLKLNDKQKAIMNLFNVNYSFGSIVEEYLGYNAVTYIDGVYWDEFEEYNN